MDDFPAKSGRERKPPATMGIRAGAALLSGKAAWMATFAAVMLAHFAAKYFFFPDDGIADLPDAKYFVWGALMILAAYPSARVFTFLLVWFLLKERRALRGGMAEGGADHTVFVALLCIIPWMVQIAFFVFLFYCAHLIASAIW